MISLFYKISAILKELGKIMTKDHKIVPRFHQSKTTFARRMLRVIITLSVLSTIVGIGGYWHLSTWVKSPVSLPKPKIIDFLRGTTMIQLAGILESQAVVNSSIKFFTWVRFFSDYKKFQAGLYRFEKNVSPIDIITRITNGKIYEPIILQFTIPEGFTTWQFRDRIIAKGIGTKKEVDRLLKDAKLLASLKIPANSFEGYIYPATYSFVKNISPRTAIQHAVETFWEKLPPNYEAMVEKQGLTLNEAVIFASLIELETQHDDEKHQVSEVIWRRLKRKEPLAIDAAIIYGIKDYAGDIRWKHLKDTKNPYNTRIHPGLPPTAIGSPSSSSLKAVLHPSNKGYYYYVLDIESKSRHHFSKTLAEHNKYVKKLIKATKRKKRSAQQQNKNKS